MQYDKEFFDYGLRRIGTHSEKWDAMRAEQGQDMLAAWVADMDFESPHEVRDVLLARAAHPTYGYTELCDEDFDAPIRFWKRRHSVSLTRENIAFMPCVITGLKTAVQLYTGDGDKVLLLTPVYGPFYGACEGNGREIVNLPLEMDSSRRYQMDFGKIERAFESGVKLMLLCNPHNPGSRAWDRDTLTRLVSLCVEYGVKLVSDEIHADFVFTQQGHISILTIENNEKCAIALSAASKTFNLAGLQQAMALSHNSEMIREFSLRMEKSGVTSGNIFALEGTRTAYDKGDEWLDALREYLIGNAEIVKSAMDGIEGIKMTPQDASYLAWLDCSAISADNDELMRRFRSARIEVSDGRIFGENAAGFIRFNFAMPRFVLAPALERFKKAME
ncbi:MAG: PatB family C-S lyase [Eubacteriales bacterium]|nr:PatB family C-S lyase [Eubacteriales bacterium]MDD3882955.1 PatB family C-S lyase [Eubacteriales bacterium]MDD4513498.1 PatB family C-S lyase [Eubacteriales bacterium]